MTLLLISISIKTILMQHRERAGGPGQELGKQRGREFQHGAPSGRAGWARQGRGGVAGVWR